MVFQIVAMMLLSSCYSSACQTPDLCEVSLETSSCISTFIYLYILFQFFCPSLCFVLYVLWGKRRALDLRLVIELSYRKMHP